MNNKIIINGYEMMCPKCNECIGLDVDLDKGDIICNKCSFKGLVEDFDVELRLK